MKQGTGIALKAIKVRGHKHGRDMMTPWCRQELPDERVTENEHRLRLADGRILACLELGDRGDGPALCFVIARSIPSTHSKEEPTMSEARLEQHVDPKARGPETIDLDIDENGSPVTLEAGSWLVCFVPGLQKQWWHPFVNRRHKHVFALRPAGPGEWTLFEPWWHRLLTATITAEQARKFLLWGARGDVLHVREAVPGQGSQIRGWMTCATLASYLLGRKYWVWTPHGLYKLLLREPNVCRVDVARLVELDAAKLAEASQVIAACEECAPGAHQQRPGAPKPFCMKCGRDLERAA